MRSFIDAHPGWLTVVRLPAYAPDLNLAAGTAGQLAAIAKNRLKSIQYRPQLIDAFLTQTGSPSSRHRHQTLAFQPL
jgi:putative transposase